MYRGASAGSNIGTYRSCDYAENFTIIQDIKIADSEPGFGECELFFINGYIPCQYRFLHTYNLYETYTEIPIDCEFVYYTRISMCDIRKPTRLLLFGRGKVLDTAFAEV